MEIKAVIEALKTVKKSSSINIYSDSLYVQNGITKWIFNWKKNNWRSANRKPVKNIELWRNGAWNDLNALECERFVDVQ